VFHQKFGNGNVTLVDGNKLTMRFDKAAKSAWWIVLWSGFDGAISQERKAVSAQS
jgi:hypothetical protein